MKTIRRLLKYVHQFAELIFLPLHMVSLMIPKKRSLVIVGEWNGNLRKDNAHTLGLELKKIQTKLEIYFITKDKKQSGGEVLYIYSLKSIKLHLRAKTFIVGSGKSDVIKYFITKKSILFNTWHGIPIKKIHFLVKKKSILLNIRDLIMPYFCEKPDYILAEPGFEKIMAEAFLPRLGVISVNQPKWLNVVKVKSEYNHLVYTPTFRDENASYFPITVNELSDIDSILEEKKTIKILIYLHPACTFRPTRKYKNILFNGYDCQLDLYQDAFGIADLIISDVSSTIIEADKMGIPFECYFPDEDDYIKKSRPLIKSVYNTYCTKKIVNIVDFINGIDLHSKKTVSKLNKNQIKLKIKYIADLILTS